MGPISGTYQGRLRTEFAWSWTCNLFVTARGREVFEKEAVTGCEFYETMIHPPRPGLCSEVVAVGFTFGDEKSRTPGFYAYISPPPQGIERADYGVTGATYNTAADLATLPWEVVRTSNDPHQVVLRFADAVYAVAVNLGGWPADWVGPRHDGWFASTHRMP